jgi:uncharacterized protein YaiE (UPF0345 family)
MKFEQVSVVKLANMYFEGRVSSRTLVLSDGSQKTLGVMLPGEYEFNTEQAELMEIQAGKVLVLLSDESIWRTFTAHGVFEVPANSTFKIKVIEAVDYCCSYF